jgi:hypothetical protein
MKTVLFSTSSLWNCGDDFIRDGVLAVLGLDRAVRQLWWNRGFGITARYANDLAVNLPLTDYVIIAGTPRWIFNNEAVYRHCLRHDIPVALIGVGTGEFVGRAGYELMRRVADAGLCEIALARDHDALTKLRELGFGHAELTLDPCFFKRPVNSPERTLSIVGWRQQFTLDGDPRLPIRYPVLVGMEVLKRTFRGAASRNRDIYDQLMLDTFNQVPAPRLVTVHDNREISRAEDLFGRENVFYSTDPSLMFDVYSRCRLYVGSRIHGAIPALIHGARVSVVYATNKASVLTSARQILANGVDGLQDSISVYRIGKDEVAVRYGQDGGFSVAQLGQAIERERLRIRSLLKTRASLGGLLTSDAD